MRTFLASLLIGTVFVTSALRADTLQFDLAIRNHAFEPAEIKIPANTKVKLLVKNLDATPEEFESHDLNREKVIKGNSEAAIFVGPLKPGVYGFFGEFNPKTAQGKLIAE